MLSLWAIFKGKEKEQKQQCIRVTEIILTSLHWQMLQRYINCWPEAIKQVSQGWHNEFLMVWKITSIFGIPPPYRSFNWIDRGLIQPSFHLTLAKEDYRLFKWPAVQHPLCHMMQAFWSLQCSDFNSSFGPLHLLQVCHTDSETPCIYVHFFFKFKILIFT